MPPTADRVEMVRRMLRAEALHLCAGVSPGARLLYVYGALVCNSLGVVKKAQIEPPWDQETEAVARQLCAEFNLLGVDN